jgi:hypothetical protein
MEDMKCFVNGCDGDCIIGFADESACEEHRKMFARRYGTIARKCEEGLFWIIHMGVEA